MGKIVINMVPTLVAVSLKFLTSCILSGVIYGLYPSLFEIHNKNVLDLVYTDLD